jgi:hypothetical protein
MKAAAYKTRKVCYTKACFLRSSVARANEPRSGCGYPFQRRSRTQPVLDTNVQIHGVDYSGLEFPSTVAMSLREIP